MTSYSLEIDYELSGNYTVLAGLSVKRMALSLLVTGLKRG